MERYAYNENGVRTAKNFFDKENRYIGRMQFYLDGNTIVAQEYEGETIWFHYDGEGMLAGFDIDGTYYYYLRDGQNNIVGILDSNCNQVVSYQYDSWGKLLSITGSMADTIGVKNPFRYRGYYYDTDTGLYYLQSRYYDPEIGRFINADALLGANADMQAYNLFAYCSNDPINCSDPVGCGKIRDAWNWVKGKATQAKNAVVGWFDRNFEAGLTANQTNYNPIYEVNMPIISVSTGTQTMDNIPAFSKPVSAYYNTKTGSAGVKATYKGGSLSAGIDKNHKTFSGGFKYKDTSYNITLQCPLTTADINLFLTTSTSSNGEGIGSYVKISINQWELLAAALVAVYAPQLLPVIITSAQRQPA